MARTALLLGATGLVGSRLLPRLLEHPAYGRVVAATRRPLSVTHDRLDPVPLEAPFPALDDAFVALGTTLRKAGSAAGFRAVDHGLVVEGAVRARKAGARRLLLVSAVGADPTSNVFYNRVKGEAERDVAALGWEACHLFRPSFLLGPREERRTGERIGIAAARILRPLLPAALRPIHADTLAAAMVEAATRELTGRLVWEGEGLTALAGRARR